MRLICLCIGIILSAHAISFAQCDPAPAIITDSWLEVHAQEIFMDCCCYKNVFDPNPVVDPDPIPGSQGSCCGALQFGCSNHRVDIYWSVEGKVTQGTRNYKVNGQWASDGEHFDYEIWVACYCGGEFNQWCGEGPVWVEGDSYKKYNCESCD